MGISTQVFNKFHLYEPAAHFGFWAIQVNVILCEKRRGERKKRKRKERGRKGEKKEGKGLNQQQCIARHLYSMLSLLLPNNLL